MLPPQTLERAIDKTAREEWGRVLASLVKTLGDFQLAEDCLQDAVIKAMQHWKENGLPRSPSAWLITVARRKAIDRLRQHQNFARKKGEISYLLDLENQSPEETETQVIPDKRLEMIFTCCHPSIEEKSRVALTLRTLGGLSTDEIAAAFLDKHDAMQQRLTRAKKKIVRAGIPYRVPEAADLHERLASVLRVIYLIFNEGYSASGGTELMRADLSEEAIRLARIIHQLLPQEAEISGLLALMLLHDSRRVTRRDAKGQMIPLEAQNRARWHAGKIAEGTALLKTALRQGRVGPYQLQAAISAVHAQAPSWQDTDWHEITALYEVLFAVQPSPVVRINQAVAISYARSLTQALQVLESAVQDTKLSRYQPYLAAKADMLVRSGRPDEAATCFAAAIRETDNAAEKAFLRDRLENLKAE